MDGTGVFVGRDKELAAIGTCASAARQGEVWVVAVEGEAGVGKTSLVRRALARVPDFEVWWAGCDEAERDFGFGMVTQLLSRLPSEALTASPLLASRPGADTSALAVGSELLDLLERRQALTPVAVVVDDIQWADEESRTALAFVLRRLWSARVLVVVCARTRPGQEAVEGQRPGERLYRGAGRIRNVVLHGLDDDALAELVAAVGGHRLGPAARERLLEHTGGHPLHLLALLADLSPQELADTGRPLPVPDTLAGTVEHALAQLPGPSRALVEALAVLNSRVPLVLAGQVAGLADPAAVLGPALHSGLVQWWPGEPSTPVRLRHALQRDAVYHALDPARRFALHRAATPLVDEHSAWLHRVAASDQVNEDLAARLEEEAERNSEQPDRAATLLLWAADLSEERERRERRLTEAAVALVVSGRTARALTLRQAVLGCRPSPLRQALLGAMATARGEPQAAERFLTEAVATADDDHTRLLAALWLSGHYLLWSRNEEALPVLLRALNLPVPEVQLTRSLRSLFALALAHSDGPLAGLAALGDLDLPAAARDVPLSDSPLLAPRGTLRGLAGELTAGITDLTALVEREPGTVLTDTAASGYAHRGLFQYLTGAWDEALSSAQEALTLTGAQEHHPSLALAHTVAAMVLAGRGAREESEAHLRACERAVGGITTLYPLIARAAAAQARADHPAMASALAGLPAVPEPMRRTWQLLWRPREAEALVETRAEDAAARLEDLRALAARTPCLLDASCWLSGRHTALGGDPRTALDILRAGLAAPPPPDRVALHHARLHHVCARLLLEGGERRAAAPLLRTAHRQYRELGAEPFARRVAEDLVACGAATDTADLDPGDAASRLTERERTIARLAAAGNTNREIARRLCISAKTVEYHLGHIYLKLGIASRRQLRPLLGQ